MFCLFCDEVVRLRTDMKWLAVCFMYGWQVIVELYFVLEPIATSYKSGYIITHLHCSLVALKSSQLGELNFVMKHIIYCSNSGRDLHSVSYVLQLHQVKEEIHVGPTGCFD
jgi:hypothetical protein